MNKKEWTFEELVHLKTDLYREVMDNIEDISAIEGKDFKLFEMPNLLELDNRNIFYADIECDTSNLH